MCLKGHLCRVPVESRGPMENRQAEKTSMRAMASSSQTDQTVTKYQLSQLSHDVYANWYQ